MTVLYRAYFYEQPAGLTPHQLSIESPLGEEYSEALICPGPGDDRLRLDSFQWVRNQTPTNPSRQTQSLSRRVISHES